MLNYIILAHDNPAQLYRLINRLDQPEAFFYIHIDKRVDIKPFLIDKENVYFLDKRVAYPWGDIGGVHATLLAMQQIVKHHRNGYCILLSGQDYPIKSNRVIKEFYASHHQCFIYASPLPDQMMPNGAIDRVTLYKYFLSDKRGDYTLISLEHC
jgi:hypothetical protein